MKLADLTARTRGLDIDVGMGDHIHVEYRYHYLTEAIASRIRAIEEVDERTALRRTCDLICLLVDSWDLTDESGEMAKLDTDSLVDSGFSLDLANFVLEALSQDTQVPKVNSEP